MERDQLRTIGARVAVALEASDRSQSVAAKHLGISQSLLSRAIAGERSFHPQQLRKLARFCRVSAAWLTTGEGKPPALRNPPSTSAPLSRRDRPLPLTGHLVGGYRVRPALGRRWLRQLARETGVPQLGSDSDAIYLVIVREK